MAQWPHIAVSDPLDTAPCTVGGNWSPGETCVAPGGPSGETKDLQSARSFPVFCLNQQHFARVPLDVHTTYRMALRVASRTHVCGES